MGYGKDAVCVGEVDERVGWWTLVVETSARVFVGFAPCVRGILDSVGRLMAHRSMVRLLVSLSLCLSTIATSLGVLG